MAPFTIPSVTFDDPRTVPGEIRCFQKDRIVAQTGLKLSGEGALRGGLVHCAFTPFNFRGDHLELSADDPVLSAVVCSGAEVSFVNTQNGSIESQTSSAGASCLCCNIRNDGKLLIESDETGAVRIIRTKKRIVLRNYQHHTGPVRQCNFTRDRVSAFSAGDDLRAIQWDISSDSPVRVYEQIHTDNIPCCQVPTQGDGPLSEFFTASKDGTVKRWDARSEETNASQVFQHKKGVNCLALLERESQIISGSGKSIFIWDLRKTDSFLLKRRHHLGSVTNLSVVSTDTLRAVQILTSSASDRTVKLSDYETGSGCVRLLRTIELSSSPSCSGLAANVIFAGCADGTFKVWLIEGSVTASKGPSSQNAALRRPVAGTRFFLNQSRTDFGTDHCGKKDLVLSVMKGRKYTPKLGSLLRSFQHQKAVVHAARSREKKDYLNHFVILCEELLDRGVMDVAMRGKDEAEALDILNCFLQILTAHNPVFLTDFRMENLALNALNKFLLENPWIQESKDEELLQVLLKLKTLIDEAASLMPDLRNVDFLLRKAVATTRIPTGQSGPFWW